MRTAREIDLDGKKTSDEIKIIQITDTHLFSDKTSQLHGYCTHQSLTEIIEHLIDDRLKKEDVVLLTGDISQDESLESYRLALIQLERLKSTVYWIHGNHDDESKIKTVFDTSKYVKKLNKFSIKNWDFISINTCRRGTDKGYIDECEMKIFLEKVDESKKSNKNIAIVMHHHPVPVDTPLVDECGLQNSEIFLDTLNKNSEIKLVICGHVHGDYRISLGGKVIETCPATCFQWVKGTDQVKTENRKGFKVFNISTNSCSSSTIFI